MENANEIKEYEEILKAKIEYYGETKAAYQFAAQEYVKQYLQKANAKLIKQKEDAPMFRNTGETFYRATVLMGLLAANNIELTWFNYFICLIIAAFASLEIKKTK